MTDVIATTIATYEQVAEQYAKRHSDISETQDCADLFRLRLKGKNVLDVGCGHGRDANYFSTEYGLEVTGIDLSTKLLEIASQTAPQAHFKRMDMRALASLDNIFPDNLFDGIWACASLMHIPKDQAPATLKGFHRVLKPQGLLYISVSRGVGEGFENRSYNTPRFFACYAKQELEEILNSSGFDEIDSLGTSNEKWVSLYATKSHS